VAERHAHLQAGGFAGLVAALFRQQVHAVVVLAAKPQLALARDPHWWRPARVALVVLGGGNQLHLAGLLQLGVAQQQAAAVAGAAAHGAQVLAAFWLS
jgi:hypothetical protein